MIEYYVARVQVDGEEGFTVTKFDGKSVPERVYSMTAKNDRIDCDCPSPHRPCKHARLVQCWLDEDEPTTAMAMRFVKISTRKRYVVKL